MHVTQSVTCQMISVSFYKAQERQRSVFDALRSNFAQTDDVMCGFCYINPWNIPSKFQSLPYNPQRKEEELTNKTETLYKVSEHNKNEMKEDCSGQESVLTAHFNVLNYSQWSSPLRLISHSGLSDSDIITSEVFGRPGRHQLLSSNTKLVSGSQPNALIQLLSTCSFPALNNL